MLRAQQTVALAPQVLVEFLHVVTDPRRFQQPLTMAVALQKASFWWNATEVTRVFPNEESTRQMLEWLAQHQLGRKRLLDTQLAATLWTAGVRTLITSNPGDFHAFGFQLLTPT